MAEDICQSLRQHDFRERIDDVLRYVTPIPFEERGTGALAGKTVVFTGKFTKFTRAEAKAQAVRLGAKVGSEVTTKTHWVVIGQDSGRKSLKAKELGLRILTEDEWLSQIAS